MPFLFVLGGEKFMSKKLIKNFYDWCIENNRYDLIERWDNKCSPKEVGFTSSKVFAFK